MFGYACNETTEAMPLSISMAHKLMFELAQIRKRETVKFLRPDSKSQVTVEYRDGKAARIDTDRTLDSTLAWTSIKNTFVKNLSWKN